MSLLESLPIGCLVSPKQERCYTNVRSKGRTRRYQKIWSGVIRICNEENRERPIKKSRTLAFGQSALVLEHGGTERYPMVKVLSSAGGSQWVGWALAEDVEAVETVTAINEKEADKPVIP